MEGVCGKECCEIDMVRKGWLKEGGRVVSAWWKDMMRINMACV